MEGSCPGAGPFLVAHLSPLPPLAVPPLPHCPAAPTLLAESRQRPRRLRRRTPSGGSSSGDESSDGSDGEHEGGGSSEPNGLSDWQLRRSKSWDGHMQQTDTLDDALPLVRGRRDISGLCESRALC